MSSRYQPTLQRLQRDIDELVQLLAHVGENAPREGEARGPRAPSFGAGAPGEDPPPPGAHHTPAESGPTSRPLSVGAACHHCLGTGIGVDTLPCLYCHDGVWSRAI